MNKSQEIEADNIKNTYIGKNENSRSRGIDGHYTLIMTGTINPNAFGRGKMPNVSDDEVKARLRQYEEAIEAYIELSSFTDIVFVENSCFEIDTQKYIDMALSMNKRFEYLPMVLTPQQTSNMLQKGKSYGEALLIDFAMKNSMLVSEVEEVYKVTGRVFIRNSFDIIKGSRRGTSQFIVKNPRKLIQHKEPWYQETMNTVFFKVTKKDYFLAFDGGWTECDDYTAGRGTPVNNIEQIWYRRAKNINLNIECFSVYPDFHGTQATTTGHPYDESSVKRYLRTALCKMGYYSLKD